MADIETFFDLSSPWTRIAFHNLRGLAGEMGVTVHWRPFLVGGVFNAVNDSVYAMRADMDAPKSRHQTRWIHEWAAVAGLPMKFPSEHHPVKSILPMRACCCLEDDQPALETFAEACFDAYFREGRNLDDPEVIAAIADALGHDGRGLVEQTADPAIKARLRENTDEAIARGAYGSPTIFVGDALYFGNDQLPLVRRALEIRGERPAK
ncbi:MAG: 2-hydroxychromene-2-carboxylate isomerase [Pseudomonadota bacterium]|nr:2-hydroxychromene-2-carboxylate isomerase [Pseudomonadota bacterium]